MEFEEVINKRITTLRYKKQKVKENDIEKIINSAIIAPSAKNRQPWRFYILNEEERNKIAKASSEHWKREGFKELVGKRISESRKGKKLNKSIWNKNKHTGYHWYTNGVENKLSKSCPKGFYEGRKISEESIIKMSEKLKGRHHFISEETKRKISESNKNNPNKAMLGRHHSEETKKKMSEKAKGKFVKNETKEKLSNYMKGKRMKIVNGKRTWV